MKLTKLSLAAMMVVGAFSAANATSLEDALKGVNLDGYARYRFNDAGKNSNGTFKDKEDNNTVKNKSTNHKNSFKASLLFTTPVVENVNATVRFDADGGAERLQSDKMSDSALTLNRAYLTFTPIKELKVLVGKQYIGTPVEDSDGAGIKVLYTAAEGLTLAAAYFDDLDSDATSKDGLDKAYAAGVIYSTDTFGGRLWYVGAKTGAKKSTSVVFAEASGSFDVAEGVNIGAKLQYAQKSTGSGGKKPNTIRLGLTSKIQNFDVKAGYFMNDKDDGGAVALDGSNGTDNDLIYPGWKSIVTGANAKTFYLGAGATFGKFGTELAYLNISKSADKSEIYGKVSYAVTSKLSTYVKYSRRAQRKVEDTVNGGKTDGKAKSNFEFEAKYSF